jgi:uncharacterized membrane protein
LNPVIEFFGRFHPLLVHLPIGFLVLLGLLELLALNPRRAQLALATGTILWLAVLGAFASATCGWLLAWNGSYGGAAFAWHKWLGTGLAVATAALALWHRRVGTGRSYRLGLVGGLLLLAVASHFGGSLTHGEDYLTAPLKKVFARAGASASKPAFTAVIKPILDEYCTSCHGEKKSKAGLRLDSCEAMLVGGDSGPAIVPGNAAESRLLSSILASEMVESHMPPVNKPQPSTNDIALEAGADATNTVAALHPPANIQALIDARTAPRP